MQLGQLEHLHTLILDRNQYTSHVKFPFMPSVRVVCINQNKIRNLPVFVEEIARKFPNIKSVAVIFFSSPFPFSLFTFAKVVIRRLNAMICVFEDPFYRFIGSFYRDGVR